MAIGLAIVNLAAGPATAQTMPEWVKNFSVHGYLTQAYARSNENQIFGISDKGTADYRTAALVFRYDMSTNDSLVVQLEHERLGQSPLDGGDDNLDFDWGFYEHRFANGFSARVGKIAVPFGMYNEIRDAGVSLPLYRPDPCFYGEGTLSVETFNGGMAAWDGDIADSWRLKAQLFTGNTELLVSDDAEESGYIKSEGRNLIGLTTWLTTPVDGLRIGAGISDWQALDLFVHDWEGDLLQYWIAADGAFERFQLRGEWKRAVAESPVGDAIVSGGYVQAGFNVLPDLTLIGQVSRLDLELPVAPGIAVDGDWHQEEVLGARYAFRYDLVLKVEYHWTEGYLNDGQDLAGFPDAARKTNFGIISLSAAF